MSPNYIRLWLDLSIDRLEWLHEHARLFDDVDPDSEYLRGRKDVTRDYEQTVKDLKELKDYVSN